MKKVIFVVLTLILILTGSYASIASKEESVITRTVPTTATPMYITGQIEWIAKIFSPECRIKKSNPETGGG
jgi:hypothetical protein